MVSVNYALVGANGDEIVFDYQNYVLNTDFTGFNIPPALVRIENSAGDGGVFRHAKRGVRTVDLPITVLGTDRSDVQTKLRRLGKLTQNVTGPLTLEARYTDGETLRLLTYYTGGAEGQWGSSAGMVWARWTLSLQAPQPYWESAALEQFTVTRGSTGRGLLPQFSKLRISSSQAIGTVLIDNTGDVPMFPTYRIIGPITGLDISSNGFSFGFTDPIPAGETIFVNTETGEVTDGDGNNVYALLKPAPKLFRIPVGESAILINGTDVTEDTRVDVYFRKRFEVVH
jgi:hypothetical protein